MTLAELQADTLFLANTVSAQYADIAIKRNLNIHYDIAVLDIWDSAADWQFDEGIDELPIGTAALVAEQDNYAIPTDAREVERVEVKDSNGKYIKLVSIDSANIKDSLEQFRGNSGTPAYYDIIGRSLILYPTPSYSSDEGLLVAVSKSVTQLSESTDEPRIEREFHRIISLGAALDWCIAKGNPTKRAEIERELLKLQIKLRKFYANRNKDYDTRIKPAMQNYE